MDSALRRQLIEGIAAEREINRKLKKQYYLSHFYEFNKEVLGWQDIYEPLHRPLCNFVTDNIGRKQLLIELPRSTFKSSMVTVGYTVWRIVNNPDIRILLVNATYPMVTKFISQIQDQLKKNPQILEIYGDLSADAEIWNENTIKLKTDHSYKTKEPTLFGYGMQGNLVSAHYDVILLDDVVNWDNVATLDQLEKTKDFYRSCIDLLDPPSPDLVRGIVVIGTPYHYADLYAWIENKDNDVHKYFAIMRKPAFTGDWDEGDLLFPDRLDWKRLRYLRSVEGPTHFASQYMLVPMLSEDSIFKYDFRYYEEDDLKGMDVLTFMTVDPAFSTEKSADQTAMVVISVDKNNTWYVRDVLVGRWNPNDFIRELMYMDEKWKPMSIGIETVAFQKALAVFLREEVRRQHKNPLPIKELRPETGRTSGMSVSKEYRIQSLEPRYAEGMIYHNKSLKYNEALEDQLRRFPHNDKDDIIDALAYHVAFAFPPRAYEQRSDWESTSRRKYLY